MTRREKLNLEGFLPYRLSVLSNTVSSAIAAAYFANFGLSIPEWRVMAVLAANPGLSAAEVTARTAMDKVAVSRAVATLLSASRLQRTTAPADRRRTHLALSSAGVRVYATLDRILRVLLGRAVELGPAHAR
jgi:DNA-binding MarR family transcriptional regulator